jgi:hypothetical protein
MDALASAIELVKAAGYTVRKPSKRSKASKAQKGPSCIVLFADGTKTRMTTHCPGDVLDYGRGERIARVAWSSRHKAAVECSPPISSISFERDGVVLGERMPVKPGDGLVEWLNVALAA